MYHANQSVVPSRKISFFRCIALLITLTGMLSFAGCASYRNISPSLPPVMTQDELQRPYTKLGELTCSRQRLGSVVGVTTQDYEWAYRELREGAERLGADAVILPEVRVEQNVFLLFPVSEVKAKGIAIRFH